MNHWSKQEAGWQCLVAHDLMMVWSRKVDQAGLVQQMHVVALPTLLDHCIADWQVEVDVVLPMPESFEVEVEVEVELEHEVEVELEVGLECQVMV